MQTIHVPLGQRAYDVFIGEGLLARSGALIAETLGPQKILLVSDSNVAGLGYADTVAQSLVGQGVAAQLLVLPPGETHKSLASYERILSVAAQLELTGSDAFAALGGGVVGDLTGFAAATFRRGMPFVQLPTTLLAAVDSSVGGKTGLNLAAGKNLVGAFWQPALVLCDTQAHATLPSGEYANGAAECLKYGILFDEALFDELSRGGALSQAQIARCVALKRDVVLQDERDTGPRRLLNLGHTLGHAIEQVSGYRVGHGEAVAIGIALMCKAFCPEIYHRVCAALRKNALPVACDYSVGELFSALVQDKKRSGSEITVVIPRAVGSCELRGLPLAELRRLLEECV